MLAFLIFSIGLGICFYYGQQWYELPTYTEADIDASTELNLQMDLQRLGPLSQPKTKDELELMRAKLHAEIAGSIKQQSDKIHLRFSVGLIALILGLGQFVSSWAMRRRQAP